MHALARHPADVYTLARVAAAVLGTVSLWLLYPTGARLFDRAVGLLAAAIEAVAFLPVFYAHLALNDVPTLAPLTLSLLGSAGVLRKGRARDYVIAGVGLGLACATKYTAGIVLVPLIAAVAARFLDGGSAAGRHALGGLALAAVASLGAFLLANPYSLLDYSAFHARTRAPVDAVRGSAGQARRAERGRPRYYLWSLTWGLGWVPALAALGGGAHRWRRERALWLAARPRRAAFLAFMGAAGPLLRALAAADLPDPLPARGALRAQAARDGARLLGRWRRAGGPAPAGALLTPACPRCASRWRRPGRGAARPGPHLQHPLGDGALARRHAHADARVDARPRPAGAPIVVEPVSPNEWAHALGNGYPSTASSRIAPRRRGCSRRAHRQHESASRTTSARSPRR